MSSHQKSFPAWTTTPGLELLLTSRNPLANPLVPGGAAAISPSFILAIQQNETPKNASSITLQVGLPEQLPLPQGVCKARSPCWPPDPRHGARSPSQGHHSFLLLHPCASLCLSKHTDRAVIKPTHQERLSLLSLQAAQHLPPLSPSLLDSPGLQAWLSRCIPP